MEAADFVPGQWDKPMQADNMVKSESQQSLNSQTDGGSILPGSDAHAQSWAQDYAHQYYSAQVRQDSRCCLDVLQVVHALLLCMAERPGSMRLAHASCMTAAEGVIACRAGCGVSSTSSMVHLAMMSPGYTSGTLAPW